MLLETAKRYLTRPYPALGIVLLTDKPGELGDTYRPPRQVLIPMFESSLEIAPDTRAVVASAKRGVQTPVKLEPGPDRGLRAVSRLVPGLEICQHRGQPFERMLAGAFDRSSLLGFLDIVFIQ